MKSRPEEPRNRRPNGQFGNTPAQWYISGEPCACGHDDDVHGPWDDAIPRLPHVEGPLDRAPDGVLSWCLDGDCEGCPGMTPHQLGYSRCERRGGLDAHPGIEGACGEFVRTDEPCGEHPDGDGGVAP